MTKEEFKSRIEDLVEEYFENKNEDVSDCFTIIYPDGNSISFNYDFNKN